MVAESVEHWSRVREIVNSNPGQYQDNVIDRGNRIMMPEAGLPLGQNSQHKCMLSQVGTHPTMTLDVARM